MYQADNQNRSNNLHIYNLFITIKFGIDDRNGMQFVKSGKVSYQKLEAAVLLKKRTKLLIRG